MIEGVVAVLVVGVAKMVVGGVKGREGTVPRGEEALR